MKFNILSAVTAAFVLTTVSLNVNAQKLPNVQQSGLKAPANIKIDGKATEWEGKFQARNSATGLTYALSNDDDNLYLVLQTGDITAINKIMGGGITLLIQKSGKKNDKDAMMINYPVYRKNTHPLFSFSYDRSAQVKPLSPAAVDSDMHFNNTKMNTPAKSIRTAGLLNTDSLLSVYNTDGVKAMQLFDNKHIYTCEISISLKSLGFSSNTVASFSYHILLNSGPNKSNGMADLMNLPASMVNSEAALYSTTDFWGEYVLVK